MRERCENIGFIKGSWLYNWKKDPVKIELSSAGDHILCRFDHKYFPTYIGEIYSQFSSALIEICVGSDRLLGGCNQFIQRDMDVMALGFQKFETPFSNGEVVLNYGLEIPNLPKGICGSGDQFEMEHNNHEYNVIEMEAYALAKVSKEENMPFLCLKYISDGADGNAVEDWQTEVKKAAIALKNALI